MSVHKPPTTVKNLTKLFKEIAYNQVYNDLYSSPSTSETTITDNIITVLRKKRNADLFAIPGVNEPKKGADLEWWIIYKGDKKKPIQAMHLRIQAKKQKKSTKKTPAKYDKINHPPNKHGIQIDLLIDGCTAEKAIPLYCFYNYHFDDKTQNDVEEKAWKYAHAEDIESTRVNGKINDDYETLDALAKPMHELADMAQKEPYKILEKFINKNPGTSIDPSTYIYDRLPDYVLDNLVTNELTNHPFMKRNPWFAGVISERTLKNRIKKSDTFYISVFGIAETLGFLGKIMSSFIMWLKRKMRYGVKTLPIIITISDEPLFFKRKNKKRFEFE